MWDGELAQLAELSRRGPGVGLGVKVPKGTSGLGGGGREAVSCCRAVLSPHMSPRGAVSWRAAVLEARALSSGVLRGESGKSWRRGAAGALRGVRAWRRGDPRQEGKGKVIPELALPCCCWKCPRGRFPPDQHSQKLLQSIREMLSLTTGGTPVTSIVWVKTGILVTRARCAHSQPTEQAGFSPKTLHKGHMPATLQGLALRGLPISTHTPLPPI